MIYEGLKDKLNIRTSDFSVSPSQTLGAVSADFRVFGGSSRVSLGPDQIVLEFPNLSPESGDAVHILQDVSRAVYFGLPQVWPDLMLATLSVQAFPHVAFIDINADLRSFLASFARQEISDSFSDFGPISYEPGGKFRVIGAGGAWHVSAAIERSFYHENALFLNLEVIITDRAILQSYDDITASLSRLSAAALRALKLELV
jgi:hypothetical protein